MRKLFGFSLIEIMVVILIMGLLVGIVAPSVMTFISDGEKARVEQDLNNIKTALKTYSMDNFDLPTQDQGLFALVEQTNIPPIPRRWRAGGYLDAMPEDPWGREYIYEVYQGKAEVYTLGKDGEKGGEDRDSDIRMSEL